MYVRQKIQTFVLIATIFLLGGHPQPLGERGSGYCQQPGQIGSQQPGQIGCQQPGMENYKLK